MTVYIPLLAAILGALVYALVPHSKAAELGRLTYATGMLAFLLGLAGRMVKLFS